MSTSTVTIKGTGGREIQVLLAPRTPLDGHGGRIRQGWDVTSPEGRELGRITRHRPDVGAVRWTSSQPDGFQMIHSTRSEALDYLALN